MTSLTRRSIGMDLPSLLSRSWVDEVFSRDLAPIFETTRATFPYDIVDHTDADGKVTATELVFAVGGVTKNDVSLEVTGDTLSVNINKTDKDNENRVIRHKGISRRSMSVDYVLHGLDRDAISASLKDGELRILLPKQETKKITVDIKD